MAFVKFARAEIVGVKSASSQVKTASLKAFSSEGGEFNDFRTEDGYVYVRVRAISSRVNKNHDGWPSDELKKSFASFLGKPIFIDHNNHDPGRARGVVVDAKLHVEDDMDKVAKLDPYYASAPDEHLPPTWIELLLETDARAFPKLAQAIADGDIDSVSMGANVERSKCSNCGNWATSPDEYCLHVREKGAEHSKRNPKTGSLESKMSYEDCYDVGFFEISYVFDPADETALFLDKIGAIVKEGSVKPTWDEGLEAVLAADEAAQAPGGDLASYLLQLGPGHHQFEIGGVPITIYYDEQGAMGDNGSPVQGDKTGEWEVFAGHDLLSQKEITRVHVSPHGDSGYGNAQAPQYAAQQVAQAIQQYVQQQGQQQSESPVQETRVDLRGGGDQFTASLEAVLAADDQRLADTRDLPQSEMTVAPEKVDTLRQETVCPVCGSEMEDGVCEVCNYEEPPEGFGNPDLTKAEDLDEKQEAGNMEAEDAQQQSMQQTDMQGQPGGAPPGQPDATPAGMPMAASYIPAAPAGVKSEKTSADLQGGRVNTQEKPILPVSRQNSDRPKEQKTISDSRKPVESHNHKEHMTDTTKTADGPRPNGGADVQPATRVDPEGKGGIGLDPESGTKTVDVLGVGGVDTVEFDSIDLDAPVADAIGPHTDTWSGSEGDSAGQQKAVTENEPVLGAKTVKGWPDGLATDGAETVDLDAPLAEEVGGPTSTFGEDSFHITDPVTNEKFEGDEGVKDEAAAGPDHSPFPSEEEAVKAARVQWTAALKVAETEVNLGITAPEDKLNRLAELEDEPTEALTTRLDTMSKVKTAGLSKRTARAATAKTGGVPSLKPESAFARREASNNDANVDIAESIFA